MAKIVARIVTRILARIVARIVTRIVTRIVARTVTRIVARIVARVEPEARIVASPWVIPGASWVSRSCRRTSCSRKLWWGQVPPTWAVRVCIYMYLQVFTGISMYLPGKGGAALPPLHVLPVDL